MFQRIANIFSRNESDIVGYVNTVHASGGHQTPAAKEFLDLRKGDEHLQRRAETFNTLFDLSQETLVKKP